MALGPDIVVLIPGITGSVLERNGKDVWATSAGAVLRGLFSRGDTIQDLRLDDDPPDVDDLGDGVTATKLVGDVHIFPGLWKIDGYGKVAQAPPAAAASSCPARRTSSSPTTGAATTASPLASCNGRWRPGSGGGARPIPRPRSSSSPTRWAG